MLYDAEKHKDFAYNANVQCKSSLIYGAIERDVSTAVKANGELLIAAKSMNLLKALAKRLFD